MDIDNIDDACAHKDDSFYVFYRIFWNYDILHFRRKLKKLTRLS